MGKLDCRRRWKPFPLILCHVRHLGLRRHRVWIVRGAVLAQAILLSACQPPPSPPLTVETERNSLGILFVKVPAGSFPLGDARWEGSRPLRKVRMSAFWMGAHEVTNAQYELFDPKHKRGEYSTGDDEPVTDVSLEQARAFARWLSKREKAEYALPSEAQWEYAARGGLEGKDYSWGDGIDDGKALIGGLKTRPVGSFPPNGYGLYDMTGNASEMVGGFHQPYSTIPDGALDPVLSKKYDLLVRRGLGVGQALPFVGLRSPWTGDPLPDLGFRLIRKEARKG